MANSKLQSLIIKSSMTIPETISDTTFRAIYRAVKDIIDHWSDITISQNDRLTYKQKYIDPNAVDVSTGDHVGDDFIDITGKITVSNVYLDELQYVCFHVNGNKDNMQGKLKISEGLNYYVQLADTNMHNNFIETITYNTFSQDGITLMDIDSVYHSWTDYKEGSRNENLPLCGNYINELLPYTNSSENETNRKNFLNNLPDKYLFTNVNNVNQIQVYDFTPYYKVFGEYRQRSSGSAYGYNLSNWDVRNNFMLPFLWSCIPGLGDSTKRAREIPEMWFFIPAKYSAGSFTMQALIMGNKQCPIFDFIDSASQLEEAKKFCQDGNRTTIDRLFIKCRDMGGDRSDTYMTTSYIANVRHLCIDSCGKNKYMNGRGFASDWRELSDGWGSAPFYNHGTIKVTYCILLFSGRYKPPVTFSMDAEGDAAAYAWLTNPQNIRWLYKPNNNEMDGYEKYMTPTIYYTASDPEVQNGTAQEGDVKEASFECYNMYAFMPNGNYWRGKDYLGISVFVPDEWYYFFKYSYYVYDADGVSRNTPAYNEGRIEMGVESPANVTPVNNINTSYLHSFTEYKQMGAPYYNAQTDKFWWQTNTVMNTIISKNFRDTDDPHRWFAV